MTSCKDCTYHEYGSFDNAPDVLCDKCMRYCALLRTLVPCKNYDPRKEE